MNSVKEWTKYKSLMVKENYLRTYMETEWENI